MIFYISSFQNISVVPKPKSFLWIAASVAAAVAVANFKVTKTLLANGLRTLGNPHS